MGCVDHLGHKAEGRGRLNAEAFARADAPQSDEVPLPCVADLSDMLHHVETHSYQWYAIGA